LEDEIRIDLHIHTARSDGLDTPKEMIRGAIRKGLAGVAITDHDVPPPLIKMNNDFIVIPGVEVTTNKGHILLLGVYEIPPKNIDLFELIDFARERAYVIIPAHPYDIFRSGIGDLVKKIDCDAIEVINGGTFINFFNKKAKKVAKELNKPMTGGSDAHYVEVIGSAFTIFQNPVDDVDDVLDFIIKGKIVPYGKPYGVFPKIKRFIKKKLLGHSPKELD